MESRALPHPLTDMDAMFAFAMRLRGDAADINASGWAPDPEVVTWPYKLYDAGPRLALPSAWTPDGVSGRAPTSGDLARRLGAVLQASAGITKVEWTGSGLDLRSPQRPSLQWRDAKLKFKRALASGGAAYPTEVYVLLADGDGAALHHYDVGRHELVGLLPPADAITLANEIGLSRRDGQPALAFLLSSRFSKNLNKYGNFSYRLGATDCGLMLVRLKFAAAMQFGASTIHPDFPDETLAARLRFGSEEGIYAVVSSRLPFSVPPDLLGRGAAAVAAMPATVQLGRSARPSPAFAAFHAASCRAADNKPLSLRTDAETVPPATICSFDPTHVLRRSSHGQFFFPRAIEERRVMDLLRATATELGIISAELRPGNDAPPQLHLAINHVDGLAPAFYDFDAGTETLVPAQGATGGNGPGPVLQQALLADTVNLEFATFVVHISDELDFRASARPVRAYRIRQMAIGAGIDGVCRHAARLGLVAHPLHGFDHPLVDRCYGLTGHRGVEAQIAVGLTRCRPVIERAVSYD